MRRIETVTESAWQWRVYTRMKRGPIIVARHGRPALNRDLGPRLSWQEYIDWWAAYEAGALEEGQTAPQGLVDVAADADLYLTSSRLRAQQTMQKAAPGRVSEPFNVFDEAPLPPPRLNWLKLLPRNWNVLSRIVWIGGHSLDGESIREARARARVAAKQLHEQAAEGKVFLTAHGWFNRMLRRELRKLGWRCTHDGGDKYWAWRTYHFPSSDD